MERRNSPKGEIATALQVLMGKPIRSLHKISDIQSLWSETHLAAISIACSTIVCVCAHVHVCMCVGCFSWSRETVLFVFLKKESIFIALDLFFKLR